MGNIKMNLKGREENYMKTQRCTECGEILNGEVSECPKCGCPIESAEQTINKPQSNKRSGIAIASLAIGIVIIVIGILVMTKQPDMEFYTAQSYSMDYAAFGGDFYTEIYAASDMIVDELSAINNGISVLSEGIGTINQTIQFSSGIIIISIGLSTAAYSLLHIKKK